MSESQEPPERRSAPVKICPECVGEPIDGSEDCPRCGAVLVLSTTQHQRNIARAFEPNPPAEIRHTF